MGFTTSYWQKERWSRRAADTLTSYGLCWNPSLGTWDIKWPGSCFWLIMVGSVPRKCSRFSGCSATKSAPDWLACTPITLAALGGAPARQAHHPERLVLSECTPANLVHFLLRYSRKNESTSEALSPPLSTKSSSQATLYPRYQD